MSRANNQEGSVSETIRIAVKLSVNKFMKSQDQETLCFPNSFTAEERAFVHRYCLNLGLKTKSKGKKTNRFVTVSKKIDNNMLIDDASFDIIPAAKKQLVYLMQQCPLSNKEKQDLLSNTELDQFSGLEVREMNKPSGCLTNVIPQVPPQPQMVDDGNVQKLPIHEIKKEILDTIRSNQVTMIYGDTGTGKTTQVPQFILNECCESAQPCRILCMQPRRIAALSVSERVAYERGEKIGHTIGYQIRLESRLSPSTLLTFSTNGVLLRTLMGCEERLSFVTHIIVDEIHEREKLSDFLLVVLRHLLPKYPHLKLILMSATLDTNLFTQFFQDCPVIKIPAKTYFVQEYYLEDVLSMLNYKSKAMKKYENDVIHTPPKKTRWESNDSSILLNTDGDHQLSSSCSQFNCIHENSEEKVELEDSLIQMMDTALSHAYVEGTPEALTNMLSILINEKIPVDYQHSETGVTALMVAAGRGCFNNVEQLISLGSNVDIQAPNSWTALDWAQHFQHQEIYEFLKIHTSCRSSASALSANSESKSEQNLVLDMYQHSVNEDADIDNDLILSLLKYIHNTTTQGAILVFLPGYTNIVQLSEKVINDSSFQSRSNYVLYMLHSSMQSSDQRKVFKRPPKGIRKIILATNIAETSVTIDDVVHVIDCGKVKQKSFDSTSNVTLLQPVWISRASAVQRKGRAGRCSDGVVYRLFSNNRFKHMDEYQCPEILRTPLHELCLHAKSLAPHSMSIFDFLSQSPEPPMPSDIRNSIEHLVTIEAINSNEELTEIGHHLIDLPIDPTLGKMVLYSVVLKCLDPILTIVCSLAYRDPFFLPSEASQRRRVMQIKRDFAGKTFSDHMVLLRAFQSWQKAQSDGHEKFFCQSNYLSSAMMEMIAGMRSQMLSQLRASGFVRAKGSGDIRDLNTNSENWAVVKAALFVGMYPNLIRIDRQNKKMLTRLIKKVKFHTASTLNSCVTSADQNMEATYSELIDNLRSDWLIFDEMTRTGYIAYARSCTLVTPTTVALFAGPSKLPAEWLFSSSSAVMDGASDSESETPSNLSVFQVDDWINFKLSEENAQLLLHLRQKWHSMFLRRIRNPAKPWTQTDEMILASVVSVLSAQEQQLGIQQPVGIGQRPRPIHHNFIHNRTPHFEPDSSTIRFSDQTKFFHTGGDYSSSQTFPRQDHSSECSNASSSNTKFFLAIVNTERMLDILLKNFTLDSNLPSHNTLHSAALNEEQVYLMCHVYNTHHFQGYGRVSPGNRSRYSPKFFFVSRECLPFKFVTRHFCPWTLVNAALQSQGMCHEQLMVHEFNAREGQQLLDLWNEMKSRSSGNKSSYDNQSQQSWQPRNQFQVPKAGRPIKGRHNHH